MPLTLPDSPATSSMAQCHIELACALYARGRISAVAGSHIARLDVISFQRELAARNISRNYAIQDLHADLASLDRVLGP